MRGTTSRHGNYFTVNKELKFSFGIKHFNSTVFNGPLVKSVTSPTSKKGEGRSVMTRGLTERHECGRSTSRDWYTRPSCTDEP